MLMVMVWLIVMGIDITNPLNEDGDDGYSDCVEAHYGSDSSDPNNVPA